MDIILERTEARGKPRYISPSPVVDGAGNIFIGIAQTKGEGTAFTRNVLVLCLQPDGVRSIVDEREVPGTGLVDGVGIVQSGRDLHVFAGAHIGDPTARLYHYTLPVCVPYPEGQHTGMSGAYVPEQPEVEVDYQRIQEMLNAQVLSYASIARQAVRDVLAEKGVLTEAMFAGGSGSAVVYQQLVNTSFTGAKGALAEQP